MDNITDVHVNKLLDSRLIYDKYFSALSI